MLWRCPPRVSELGICVCSDRVIGLSFQLDSVFPSRIFSTCTVNFLGSLTAYIPANSSLILMSLNYSSFGSMLCSLPCISDHVQWPCLSFIFAAWLGVQPTATLRPGGGATTGGPSSHAREPQTRTPHQEGTDRRQRRQKHRLIKNTCLEMPSLICLWTDHLRVFYKC